MGKDKKAATTMNVESWKQVNIEGFEHYIVSDMGKVINTKNGKILKHISKHRKTNTKFVRLASNGRLYQISVHILVAKTFIDNPDNFNNVIHLDGDGTNNSVHNLSWCSHSDCIKHWQKFGINKRGVKQPRRVQVRCVETDQHFTSMLEASRALGLDPSAISKNVRGIYGQVKGHHFEAV